MTYSARFLTITILLLLCSQLCAYAQQTVEFRTPYGQYSLRLPSSPSGGNSATPSETIPLWSGSFDYQGANYPFTMVGGDPSVVGAGTSNVKTVLIPVRFKFGSTVVSPTQKACGDSVSALSRVKASPLFSRKITWTAGATSLGKTQFTDAFQRANFWNFVSTISPKYHVLLHPITTAPVQTVDVPPTDGYAEAGLCSGHSFGVVVIGAWLDEMVAILTNLNVRPDTVAVFVAYDIGMTPALGGNVRPLSGIGFNNGNDQTFVAASYTEPNAFIPSAGGVSTLSSMLALWMDDPLLFANAVPSWGPIPGEQLCEGFLFASSPLLGTTFPVVQKGITYDIQEPAFLSWFAREGPSDAVNGWYSLQNTLTGPPPICESRVPWVLPISRVNRVCPV